MKNLCIFILGLLVCVPTFSQVSPLSYNWEKANSDEERYWVLYNTHVAALSKNTYVDYSGLHTANIAIPHNAISIPLCRKNDFCGLVINVTNCERKMHLFKMVKKAEKINIAPKYIDNGDFSNVENLAYGNYLLTVEDENEWGKRKGYSDAVIRKEALIVLEGKALNSVVMPYNNKQSSPICFITPIDNDSIFFGNLTLNRGKDLKEQIKLVDIDRVANLIVSNITLITPQSSFYGDTAIRITNAANVTLKDIDIKGTYSQIGKYGYGIFMDNVTNFKGIRIKGSAAWGIFGNYNINTSLLEDCSINRWDIHSYGKNVTFRNCLFFDMYNQFSSVYGEVVYDNCSFKNTIPYLNEWSFNAYVKHDVIFNNCSFYSENQNASLFKLKRDDKDVNQRPELKKKYWPNVTIFNMNVTLGKYNQTRFNILYKKYRNSGKINKFLMEMAQ